MKTVTILVCSLIIGCQAERAPAPGARKGTPPPSPTRDATLARPTPPRPAAEPASPCRDPELERAFEALTSCDYKAGILDYQCPAFKTLNQVIGARELESQALVQLTLLGLLDHAEERVRLVAAKSLSSYARQKSVIRRLEQAFGKEKSPEVRSWIIYNLHSASPEARALVLRALTKDPSPEVRSKAAQRLNLAHFVKEPEVREALFKALKDETAPEVRKRAAESLGHAAGDPAAEKALLGCLADPGIGPHCGIGLGRLGTQAGYAAVLALVSDGAKKHAVHPLYLWSLVDFAARPFFAVATVRTLLMTVAKDERMGTGSRHYAVKALGRLGRDLPAERQAVLGQLRALAADKILGVSARPEVEQLLRSGARPGARP